MEAEEAAEILLKEFKRSTRNYRYQNAHKINLEEALFMGAEALKKQVPRGLFNHKCTNCGWLISYNEKWKKYVIHCENCGQAIDWRF